MKLTFCGASQTVTGSCYLLETQGKKILVDCGMFQGKTVEHRNQRFNFDPREISYVFLTHAHMDHSGLIPKLYREGFEGKIYATSPTIEISELLLLDSAKIQEMNEFRPRNKRFGNQQRVEKPKLPLLYETNNVYKALENFVTADIGSWFDVEGIKVKFVRAGHVMGAVSIIIESESKKIIFSGDLGREDQSLIPSYELVDEEFDYVVMESLYGGIDHEGRDESIRKLAEEINLTVGGNGNVMIPVFALHRSQEIMYDLKSAFENSQISSNVQIFLDGPLSISITQIYTKYLLGNNVHFAANDNMTLTKENLFIGEANKVVKDHRESIKLLRGQGKVVLAGNGMCEGGRIHNHLPNGLKKEKNKIIFVGYQADDTLGRAIADGQEYIFLKGKKVKVRADVVYLHGFSGHAGNKDLLKWLDNKTSKRLKKVFLTHADIERSTNFKVQIENNGFETVIPDINTSYNL